MNSFKKRLTIISVNLIFMFNLGGSVYAYDGLDSGVDNVSSTTSISSYSTSESSSTTSKTVKSGTTTEKEVGIGQSNFNIVVSKDDAFTGLDTFIESYTLPTMSSETKQLLFKSLTSLVISVITGDGSYTLETFKTAFIDICVSYGIDITDDFIENLDKYTSNYLDDDFENDETNIMLNSIYISLGFITILLIALWQGGGSFR